MARKYRLEQRIAVCSFRQRRIEANRKFLLGLSFERSGIAWQHDHYISSDQCQALCKKLIAAIEGGLEHEYFKKGQEAFDSKTFMEDKTQVEKMKKVIGDKWKSERYHQLVRIGGDAMACGLHEYTKATILGALLMYAKGNTSAL